MFRYIVLYVKNTYVYVYVYNIYAYAYIFTPTPKLIPIPIPTSIPHNSFPVIYVQYVPIQSA